MVLIVLKNSSPSPSKQRGVAIAQHGSWSSKLRAHILNHKRKPRTNRE